MKKFNHARGLLGAALLLGLAYAPAALADETSQNTTQQQPQQQTAQNPMTPYATQQQTDPNFNPNVVPPWSENRNGAGEVTDPANGLTAPGYGSDSGG